MIQKDLKIVAMIFHIAPCRIRDRKDHRSDNRWRHCGSVLSFCPEIWTLCKSALCKSVLAPAAPLCSCGAGAVPAWCGTGRRSTGPGFEPWSATGQPTRAAPPPAATTISDQPGQCCPAPRRVQTPAVSSGDTVTLLQIHTQLRFISLPCTNLLRSACDS